MLLDFSYHNAHHERPIEPWYALSKLRHDYGEVRPGKVDGFIGAVCVSFLTAV